MMTFEEILAAPPVRRDEAWEKNFLKALPSLRVKVLSPEPRQGPDGWPYLFVTNEDASGEDGEPLIGILNWLSSRGIGLALNPQKATPDFVLTYGMIWNFRERGEFLTMATTAPIGKIEVADGQELLAGPPSESFLPGYARSIIKQFLMDQGAMAPKVLMVSFDKVNFDLCFSIESLKSPPENEHTGIAEAIAWFLPAHYTVGLVSEKSIPGFQPL